MVTRRRMLAGLAATSLLPSAGWSSVGTPDYLSAARAPDGTYLLAGLTTTGDITFTIPLPARGHAAAAHPERAEAVAFARRPGTFALVMDCRDGAVLKTLTAPKGRHFYGHGTFSADGTMLFTSENDYEAGEGIIGLWDVTQNYTRIGEFSSGGVGPHDLKLMPNGDTLVVANGGIETHPDMGRSKLNIPVMMPNLSYVSLTGEILEQIELTASLHKNSIRHLAVSQDGTVAFAMQWQGSNSEAPPLLGLHKRGETPHLLSAPEAVHRAMQGYAGSVAFGGEGMLVAITSPRGNQTQVFWINRREFLVSQTLEDVCGISTAPTGFYLTTGTGLTGRLRAEKRQHPLQWDNHLVAITPQA